MLACAFMKDASAEAYREVLQFFKARIPGLAPPCYMGDWDKAIRAAVHAEFPNIRSFGCLFHYGQALVKKAGSVGLAREIRSPGSALKRFLVFGALPLLPPEHIQAVTELCAGEALATDVRMNLSQIASGSSALSLR